MNIKPEYHARNFSSHAVCLVSTIISPKQPHCQNGLKLSTGSSLSWLRGAAQASSLSYGHRALAGLHHRAQGVQSCLHLPWMQPASSLLSGQSCTLSHCFAPWIQVPSPHWNSSGWQVTRALRQHVQALATQDLNLFCGTFQPHTFDTAGVLHPLSANVTEHRLLPPKQQRQQLPQPLSSYAPLPSHITLCVLGKRAPKPV